MNASPGESRGQNVENSGFKRKGRLDNAWFKYLKEGKTEKRER